MHGLMSMTWRPSALNLTTGQVQVALPGSLLNDPGGDNNAWVGSGIVKKIAVNSRDAAGTELVLVQVYDYLDDRAPAAGPPRVGQLFLSGGTPSLPFQVDATANRTATKGGDFDIVIHGATINDGIAAPTFLTNARLLYQEKAVIEDGTTAIRDLLEHDANVTCVGGMVVVLRNVSGGTATGHWSISVTYEPHRLGGYRRARNTIGNTANLLPI